jgi:protein-arginine kinase activator protein McsA
MVNMKSMKHDPVFRRITTGQVQQYGRIEPAAKGNAKPARRIRRANKNARQDFPERAFECALQRTLVIQLAGVP